MPALPSIVISASGMATGGRVLHHLARLLPGKRNTVILPGFQVPGTRGGPEVPGARPALINRPASAWRTSPARGPPGPDGFVRRRRRCRPGRRAGG
ncbi:hypothetical protein [Kribbella sp. NPDC048928]|uniref:hypothetical protein n=1 Tax=Kribbella sp. NPDC048928 TaxID=3364111 RepID=UPI00371C5CEC